MVIVATGERLRASTNTADHVRPSPTRDVVLDKAHVSAVDSQNFTRGGLQNNRELGEILDAPVIVTVPVIVTAIPTLFTVAQAHATS